MRGVWGDDPDPGEGCFFVFLNIRGVVVGCRGGGGGQGSMEESVLHTSLLVLCQRYCILECPTMRQTFRVYVAN